jgi:hypothetical protein
MSKTEQKMIELLHPLYPGQEITPLPDNPNILGDYVFNVSGLNGTVAVKDNSTIIEEDESGMASEFYDERI